MSLLDAIFPKKYKNQKVLFEQDLDAWRIATEEFLNTVNLNFTQLRKDCFLANYDYTNDGDNSLSQSLQQQINLLSSGGIPISGTTSATWTINSAGFSATISTSGLTDFRTYTFPDVSGQIVLVGATQTLTNKTITSPSITSPNIIGSVTGGATYLGPTITSPTISGTVGGTPTISGAWTFSSAPTFSTGIRVPTDQLVKLDGATGNFAILYNSALGGIILRVGGANSFILTTSTASFGADIIPNFFKYYYDGGTNTYTQFAGGKIDTYNQGTLATRINSSGEMLLPSISTPTANYANQNSFVKGWAYVRYSGNGPTITLVNSYNVSSIAGSDQTKIVVNWDTDFSSANYITNISSGFSNVGVSNADLMVVNVAGSSTINHFGAGNMTNAGVGEIHDYYIIAIGTQ